MFWLGVIKGLTIYVYKKKYYFFFFFCFFLWGGGGGGYGLHNLILVILNLFPSFNKEFPKPEKMKMYGT